MKPNWWQILGIALLILGLAWVIVNSLTDADAPDAPVPTSEQSPDDVAPEIQDE